MVTMTPDSNFADRWPELFGTLDDQQRAEVLRELAASGREGGPTREEVENLTDRARGAIDDHEYGRRARPSADGQNGGLRQLPPEGMSGVEGASHLWTG